MEGRVAAAAFALLVATLSRDEAAIRHDVPLLLAARTPCAGPSPAAAMRDAEVTAVTTAGDRATAMWSLGAAGGTLSLHKRSDRWWIDGGACGSVGPGAGRVPLAESHDGGYDAVLAMPQGAPPVPLEHFGGRAPTAAEMPPAEGMNGYYFFDLRAGATGPARVEGATLDVWFPFVLDPSRRYELWLGFVQPEIQALPGTLSANVLHFELPAFALAPGKDALGEIDGSR